MCGGNNSINIIFSATNDNQFPPTITDPDHTSVPGDDQDFTTLVTAGATIVIKKGGDISAITNVQIEPGSDIFRQDPTQQPDGSWQGVIGNPSDPTQLTGYTVFYTIGNNNYSQDPKLKIKK